MKCLLSGMDLDLLCIVAFLLFAACNFRAAITDIARMEIENGLILALLLGYLAFAFLAGLKLTLIAESGLVALCVLVVCFTLFVAGIIGAGDAKLMAVTSLWLGPALTVPYVLYSSVSGGFLALAILAVRQFPLPAPIKGRDWAERLHARSNGIPYGVALALSALFVMPGANWFRSIF